MPAEPPSRSPRHELYNDAEWYNRTINWSARLGREIPVLAEVFGRPGDGGILDAGCGVGHQAAALAKEGYRVTAADASEEMLALARRIALGQKAQVQHVSTTYARLHDATGGGFDGIYCIGNSLAAAGSGEAVAQAIQQFGKCLRPGGRLFIQVLNFPPMRLETPCVRGPRASRVGGHDYVSVRQFHFDADGAVVTNITFWNDNGWHQRAHSGRLYPVESGELQAWCVEAGLRVDDRWGNYDRDAFDPHSSVDLIIVGTRA